MKSSTDGKFTHLKENVYYYYREYRGKMRRKYFIQTTCHICGESVMRDRGNYLKSVRAGRSMRHVCGDPSCRTAFRSGKNSPSWRGGKKWKRGVAGGHILTYAPDHPNARKNYVPEHRLVMEESIGRLLGPREVVHHDDMDPSNNDISNLTLCQTVTEHNLAHSSLNRCVSELMSLGVLSFDKIERRYFVVT